jgi:DNA-binding MarR family transcriptional regulator
MVGIARWASRATVYRHVHELEAKDLVESVVPKTPGTGKRLYHLSNLGLHLLARHLDIPAHQLAHRWQGDEMGLLRLLPRLPTLLVLQDVVNRLITHTAEAITRAGRRPQLVRWTWQRDVTHRFSYREQVMRLFADGAVALCIRTQQGESSRLDQWYGLFILSTELDDERLMRLRLERLLCWREAPERWSSYQHMLPVLILARSPRQRDHWQRAVMATALKLRLDPLVGALACLPDTGRAQVNPWMLTWRTLATDSSSRLQDLLKPLPREAFPPSLRLEDDEEKERHEVGSPAHPSPVARSPERPARLRRLIAGDLANRAACARWERPEEREIVALLGVRLTPCQWSILRLLLAHPLLSAEELAAFLGLQRKSVRCALYELHRSGCLEPIPTEAGKRWRLCERGLRLMAAASHMSVRNMTTRSDDEADRKTSTRAQRGEAWLLQHIQHTAGMYGFFASVAQAAKQQPERELCWWETGASCERRYQVHEQWHNLRPDALAEYRVGSQQMRFWLEWDRGTMNVRDLAVKFDAYAHYLASREWARERSALPRLLCVAPDIAQEKRIQRVAQARLTHTPGLVVWTTTGVLLQGEGPTAPIWLRAIPPQSERPLQAGGLRRRDLFDTLPGKSGV